MSGARYSAVLEPFAVLQRHGRAWARQAVSRASSVYPPSYPCSLRSDDAPAGATRGKVRKDSDQAPGEQAARAGDRGHLRRRAVGVATGWCFGRADALPARIAGADSTATSWIATSNPGRR
jgi:hypothetical protein